MAAGKIHDDLELDKSPRRRARELVLKGLYAIEIGEADLAYVEADILDDPVLSKKNQKFANDFFALVRNKFEWANKIISELSVNWDINRLAAIDRIVLRMALVELSFIPDSPVKVSINEAIELGKKYSTAGSASFINGLLDSYAAKLKKGETAGDLTNGKD